MIDVRAIPLRTTDQAAAKAKTIPARIQNLSRGGLCILTEEPLPARGVLLCEMVLPQVPITIPALLRVCWIQERGPAAKDRLAGLQFLY